jgi:hypothetical protein
MLDLSYFQNSGNVNTQTFTNAGSWVTWVKPRGAKFVNILCIGAGGGGGAGFAGAGGSGGGGACGGYIKTQYQASILPDILYVYTGIGGSGGINAGAASTAGGISYIGLIPDSSSIANLVCVSSATTAGGGAVGTTVAGAGGTAPTIATISNAIFLNLGTFLAVVGIAGANGAAAAAGVSITPSQFITPGASGGGTTTATTARAGGKIATNGVGPVPQITGGTGTATGAQNGTRGGDGIILYKPTLIFTGGAGGGNSKTTSGTGGAGGNGAYGCGGGSGGGGTPTGGGGNGGNGGDGLIIITTSF